MPNSYLSKSQYLRGLQCHKSLWLKRENKIQPTVSDSLQTIFDEGTRVGQLAQDLFPNGNEIVFEGNSFEEKIKKTQEYIANGESTIYEATFKFDDILVMVDILHKDGLGWGIYEVKSASDVLYKNKATEVKDVYKDDLAIQYYVLRGAGLDISSASLIHINNKYIRKDFLEIDKLFSVIDLTKSVKKMQNDVTSNLKSARESLKGNEPKIKIGVHCDSPYECDFKEHCWTEKILKGYTVFNLSRLNLKKKFELYDSGITDIKDVPIDFPLSDAQKMQVEVEKSGNAIINKEGIKNFLDQLSYPLYFLDFETFQQTIPEWKGVSPYQQIPFQYSVHFLDKEGGQLNHSEFLAKEGADPREELAKKLIKDIPRGVCTLAYNMSFEKGVIKKLAGLYPQYSEHLMDIHGNIKDLIVPFRNKYYYTREMKGSSSIKKVLPALMPDSSYEGMEIGDGMTASNSYKSLHKEKDFNVRKKIRNNLLEYCKKDTKAMVDVLNSLKMMSI